MWWQDFHGLHRMFFKSSHFNMLTYLQMTLQIKNLLIMQELWKSILLL